MEKFPISFWEYLSIDSFEIRFVDDWADCGMTLAMGPAFSLVPDQIRKMRAILDATHQKGMMAIINPQMNPSHPNAPHAEKVREHCQTVLAAFGDHPAVFGVHLGDEPRKEQMESVAESMREWRRAAPHWQPYLNLLPWHFSMCDAVGYDRWSTYLDEYCRLADPPFISYDCYYHMNPGAMGDEIYFTNLKEYSGASLRNRRPFWVTQLCCPHFEYRYPTEDEFRWQMNTALAWGARGILWFVFSQRGPGSSFQNYRYAPINEFGERTDTYSSLSRVNRHFLQGIAPVMNQLQFKQAYNLAMNYAWAGFPTLDPAWRVQAVNSDCPMIISEFRHPDGHDYVALTNLSRTQNAHPTFAVAGKTPELRVVDTGGGEISVEDGATGARVRSRGSDHIAVHQFFAPGQLYLFKVVDRA